MAAVHDRAGLIRALKAGVLANLALGLTKIVAFAFTGSSAMLAEALHSIADSTNQVLLGVGLKRADRPPTEEHPLGFGKERYFWAFIVAILIFALGSAFAIYEGVHKLLHPEPIKSPAWNFAALGIGLAVESFALRVAWIEFRQWRRSNPGPILECLARTKDPTLPTVLLEDSAALAGLLVALLGVTCTTLTGNVVFDASASIAIGLILLGVAWFLARESYSLLLGEAASAADRVAIRSAVESDADVAELIHLIALQRSPEEILVLLEVRFRSTASARDVVVATAKIEKAIKDVVPNARSIYLESSASAVVSTGQPSSHHDPS